MSDVATPQPSPPREPIFNVPGAVAACCLVLLGIHAMRQFVSIETDNRLVAELALVPARFSLALHLVPDRLSASYHAIVDRDQVAASQVAFLLGDGQTRWWTLVTYALLHGSWAHVGFNCLWLVAFGSAVARRFATVRFLVLMVISAVAGAVVQWLADLTSFQIVIGASAAVAGAMGAAMRFVFQPADAPARLLDRSRLNEAYRQPALSLRQTFTTRASLTFVAFWFVSNLLVGLVPSIGGVADGPIAWQAHIGGFLTGLLLFPLFDPARPQPPDATVEHELAPDPATAA